MALAFALRRYDRSHHRGQDEDDGSLEPWVYGMIDVKQRSRVETALDRRPARPRRDGRPGVSVVFVASDDSPALLREMADRSARWQYLGVELIAVCSSHQSTSTIVALMSGESRVIYGAPGATELQLRAAGLAAATGDFVLMVDDPRGADDVWIEHLNARRATDAPGTAR